MPSEAPASCPITVAMAAPATPMAGMPNHPKIKMGSSAMLSRQPLMVPMLACNAAPSERIIYAITTFKMAGVAPSDTVQFR